MRPEALPQGWRLVCEAAEILDLQERYINREHEADEQGNRSAQYLHDAIQVSGGIRH